jgi:hypothetical protein
MFVILDLEDPGRKIFRNAQNGTNCEGWEEKTKEDIKLSVIHIFKVKFHRKI